VKVVEVSLTSSWPRIGLILVLAAALVGALVHLTARIRATQMANVVGGVENLQAALAHDPSQAKVHTRLGLYYLYDPFLFNPAQAIHHFGAAVSLHPFAWDGWSNLASAYEQQADMTNAAQSHLTAITLAPNYFYPRWAYANFLLRQGKLDHALGEFRRVADVYPETVGNICELIWQATAGNSETLVRFGSSLRSNQAKAGLSQYLARRAEYRQAVDLWQKLPKNDPTRMETGRQLVSTLTQARQWSLARLIWLDVAGKTAEVNGNAGSADLAFWNGDFEFNPTPAAFDWSIASTPEVDAGFDPFQSFHGKRSLVLDFKRYDRVNFEGITHDLWVEPSTRHVLQFYYKTEQVPQDNGLAIVLTDALAPDRFRIESPPLESTEQWSRQKITFETPAETWVLRLHIVRRPVGQVYDYIAGKVWFDTFSLTPIPTR
jgi:hypothetical protein